MIKLLETFYLKLVNSPAFCADVFSMFSQVSKVATIDRRTVSHGVDFTCMVLNIIRLITFTLRVVKTFYASAIVVTF